MVLLRRGISQIGWSRGVEADDEERIIDDMQTGGIILVARQG